MRTIRDLVGQRFGRLFVFKYIGKCSDGDHSWLCKCDCGVIKDFRHKNIVYGRTVSCGCFRDDRTRSASVTHGLSRSREHIVWKGIKKRCFDKSCQSFKDYGGRGITMFPGWVDDFQAFIDSVGFAPSTKHTIDRIDNNRGYEPGNCRWATKTEQARNTRRNKILTVYGESRCISEWSEITGIPYATIYHRIKRGWSDADAVGM